MPFVMDAYSRYFFEHMRLFGEWFFFSGIEAGLIQAEVLEPLLRELAHAQYVDTRPISGLNCMTVAMAGLCRSGGTMLTVPAESGGHMSTTTVASRLGIRTLPIPMSETYFVDLDGLDRLLAAEQPDLIYIDQSNQLFPIDPKPIREVVDLRSPGTILHVDSSHINGLILGGALPNPLERGAHTFGGSTHKTLPGPHKGFLATNDPVLRDRIDAIAYHFISQHNLAATISLAITLVEFRECGGAEYAAGVLENSNRFVRGIAARGLQAAAAEHGFTGCHQSWIMPAAGVDPIAAAHRMYEQGLLVNRFNDLPGVDRPVFRMSMAEFTRMGGGSREVDDLVDVFAAFLNGAEADQRDRIAAIRSRLARPRYCFAADQLSQIGASEEFLNMFQCVEAGISFTAPTSAT
jgi:glycine hydroxymethyltransferase